jgi:hypothetical protein
LLHFTFQNCLSCHCKTEIYLSTANGKKLGKCYNARLRFFFLINEEKTRFVGDNGIFLPAGEKAAGWRTEKQLGRAQVQFMPANTIPASTINGQVFYFFTPRSEIRPTPALAGGQILI